MDSSQGKFSSMHWAGEGGGWAGRGRGALPLFLLSPVYKLIAAQLCLALEMALVGSPRAHHLTPRSPQPLRFL